MAVTSVVVKIYGFEEANNSLIVAFNSADSSVDIDTRPKLAYQPTMFENDTPENILKEIAKSGVSIAEQQDKQDALKVDQVAVNAYKGFVGQTLSYAVADLYAADVTPVQTDV